MELPDTNMGWCLLCNRCMSECICTPIENIYSVEYRLVIDSGLFEPIFQEKVRCIAYDKYMAMVVVGTWLKTTDIIWSNEDGYTKDLHVPAGDRDVSVLKTHIYAADIGAMLKQCPLPVIFPEE